MCEYPKITFTSNKIHLEVKNCRSLIAGFMLCEHNNLTIYWLNTLAEGVFILPTTLQCTKVYNAHRRLNKILFINTLLIYTANYKSYERIINKKFIRLRNLLGLGYYLFANRWVYSF